ncbi:MAG: AbrB/MazE/SpoVT family DNA-binding domain-containing protein [Spirochaetales bacterium]
MSTRTRIDRAGRLVIPKDLRERYGLEEGVEIEIIAVPDGITLIPARTERRLVRVGRVSAIDTGAAQAPADVFDVGRIRSEQIVRKGGLLS